MGILINENQIGGGGTSNSSRNIGDIFYTTRTDNSLNGAVECNGNQYNFSDFDSNLQNLLNEGKLPYVPISEFDEMVTNQGGCDSFGYKTPKMVKIYPAGNVSERPFIYIELTDEQYNSIYDILSKCKTDDILPFRLYDIHTTELLNECYIKCYNGTMHQFDVVNYGIVENSFNIDDFYVNDSLTIPDPDKSQTDPTTYFKVPKKVGRVLVRCQKPTSDNNYTWYNVYSDGWVEQGGKIKLNGVISDNNKNIFLPVEMASSKYYNIVSQDANAGGTPRVTVGWQSTTKMTVGFVSTGGVNGEVSWEAKGYAASSEYTKDKWNYQNVQVERCMVQLFNSTTDTAVATCNQVLADVSALNQGDYVIKTQLPTEENNYSWYRLYKSGWVEQGKFRNFMESNASVTCMLIIPMKDTNYFVTGLYDTNTNAINSLSRIGVGAKTTQSFQMRTEGGQYSWEVKGFANITN